MITTENEKAPGGATKTRSKNSKFSTLQKVLETFISGENATAYDLNRVIGFNDARKAISLLRKAQYPIYDYRLRNRCKCYFLPLDWKRIMSESKSNVLQLNLFDNERNDIL